MTLRLFIAAPVPDEIAERLLTLEMDLPGASWRLREQFHLTLRFIGEVDESIARDIDNELGRIVAAPFELALAGVGSFGGKEPTALWAGVDAPPDLARLAATCESAVRRAGLPAEGGLGALLMEAGRYKEAEEAVRQAFALRPDYPLAYVRLGNILAETNRPAEAEAAYRQAIHLAPAFSLAYGALGVILASDPARQLEANAACQRAIDLAPVDASAYYSLGLAKHHAHQYIESEAAYRRSLEVHPNDLHLLHNLWYNLGNLYRELHRYPEAENALQRAIRLNPNDAVGYYAMGYLLHDMGRIIEAEDVYRIAIERDPGMASAYKRLADLLSNSTRQAEAEAAYRQAIELDPDDTFAYDNLGLLLARMGRDAEAEEAYRKAIKLDPSNANAYNNFGLLLHNRLHRDLEAQVAFQRAAEIALGGKDDVEFSLGETYYNLACLSSLQGNRESTLDYLQRSAHTNNLDREWAWRDPDLEWIRSHPRFAEIVGPEPAH